MTVSLLSVGYKSGCSHDIGAASSSPAQLVLTPIASDNFNRANSPLAGANNWLATSEGTMNVLSNEAIGTAATALGNYRTNETYSSNQYAQCALGSTGLVSGGYIGVSVRNQDSQNNYTAILFNNAGVYSLILYKKVAGTFTQLVADPIAGVPPNGAVLTLTVEGNVLSGSLVGFPTKGVAAIDTTFTSGGVPGVESFAANSLDNWVGGNAATAALSAATVTDNFNRANNGVSVGQANWQVMTYSPAVGATVDATIVTNQIVDSTITVHSGDTRTDTFHSDQWASIQEGTTAMTASGFTGVTVRCQNGGQSGYLFVFFNNAVWAIYRLDANGGGVGAGTSTVLAAAAVPGNDAAGTTYTGVAQGSRLSMRVNGSEILSVTDANYTGGAPGLMFFATASGDNWSGGNV